MVSPIKVVSTEVFRFAERSGKVYYLLVAKLSSKNTDAAAKNSEATSVVFLRSRSTSLSKRDGVNQVANDVKLDETEILSSEPSRQRNLVCVLAVKVCTVKDSSKDRFLVADSKEKEGRADFRVYVQNSDAFVKRFAFC